MGILVVYQSKTGFTQKYAEWICEALECTCIPANQLNERDIPKFDLVIFGGGIHAGMISGLKKFKRKFKMNHGKRLVVFATGATPSDATEVIQQAVSYTHLA